ncbi:anti-repressor SinI family protein [Bacillus sp. 03113]|nr:anti-repressor SinI family protein [Bacillus sp. 03113]
MVKTKNLLDGLDEEWIQLIIEAKKIGIEKEEIRHFLNKDFGKFLVTNR